jgi:bilirubin oxidase
MKKLMLYVVLMLMGHFAIGQNSLVIPDTLSGTNINLTLQNGTHQFFTGTTTNTMGANGNILGPTLLLNQGDVVNFSVNSQISDSTTIHWHGMHVSPENDGGPHTVIPPNTTWQPSFEIMDKAATYWYHPHLHHHTDKHVSKGIAGQIWVRDSEEAALNLPRTYGIDDIPLVIQTKAFDANNQILHHSNSDNVLMVNATMDATFDAPEQVARFRILNGSSQRIFNLGLTNNKAFYQIASDGGLLSAPVNLTRLQLAPGERAEILIDFSGMSGQTIHLKSFASELSNGNYGATNPGMGQGMTMTGYNPNPLNGTDFDILEFNVINATANAVTTIPTALANVTPIPASNATITRNLTFTPIQMGMNALNNGFLINNQSFDMGVINYSIPLGSVEIWSLTNQSPIAHPFHIHDVQFYILDINGAAPPANMQGRKDVVLVPTQQTVRFIAAFETFSSDTVPYMYHCHMLKHEDEGMMGQFLVTDTTSTNTNQFLLDDEVLIYPNPTTTQLNIRLKNENNAIENIQVTDVLGRVVYTENGLNTNVAIINTQGLSSGMYHVFIKTKDGIYTGKVVKQ